MPTIINGNLATFFLPAGETLTLTLAANSSCIVERMKGDVVLEKTSITTTTSYGPYRIDIGWKVTCITGSFVYSSAVDTSQISSGGSGSGFTVFGETPTGTMDGVNDTFTLSAAPPDGKIGFGVFNVQPLIQGVDYVLSGATFQTLTYTTIRPSTADGDTHNYWY